MKQHLLFICSGNLDRSPTAEGLFKNSGKYEAKSAGIHSDAKVRVSQKLIGWADMIFVMSEKEDGHITYLKNGFDLQGKPVYDLDISDMYDRDEPELITLLRQKLSIYITESV